MKLNIVKKTYTFFKIVIFLFIYEIYPITSVC